MKLTFIGTSHGVPESTRKCSCLLLAVGKRGYIFDAGVMLIAELTRMGVDVRDIKAVFITHMHGDHTNGLLEFVDLLTWYYTSARPEIWTPQANARDGVRAWLSVNHDDDLSAMPEFSTVRAGAFYDDGVIRVTAIRNSHLINRPSYSYLVEAEGKRVVITGDMSDDNYSDFPKCAFEPCDIVITEAAHCALTSCVDVFAKIKAPRLFVSHIAPHNEPEAAKLNDIMPYDVIVASDGMEIEL